MRFCETNRIGFAQKTACIHLRWNSLYGWSLGFPIRFVWRGNEVASLASGNGTDNGKGLLARRDDFG